jgi:hypothetical protein
MQNVAHLSQKLYPCEQGGEGQKRTGMQKITHLFQEIDP